MIVANPTIGATSQAFSPADTSFAYGGRHAVAELSDEAISAMASDQPAIVHLRDDSEPGIVPPDQRLPRVLSKLDYCTAAATVAKANNLPVPFFANLIQQESAWRPDAVSPAGAQGIAQFMPRIARHYGLRNPFDPIHALWVSGAFVAELLQQFGNVGLAAAAYNGGSGRVQNWLSKRGKLPDETRQYVRNITGQPAERWASRKITVNDIRLPPHARCPDPVTREAQAAERAKVIQVAAVEEKKTAENAKSAKSVKTAVAKTEVAQSTPKQTKTAKQDKTPVILASAQKADRTAKAAPRKAEKAQPAKVLKIAVAEKKPAEKKIAAQAVPAKAASAKAAPAKPAAKPVKVATAR